MDPAIANLILDFTRIAAGAVIVSAVCWYGMVGLAALRRRR